MAATPESAEADFAEAARSFAELGVVFWRAVTQVEHAERLADEGRHDAAEPLFAEARAVFERLEATPWIGRASQAASAGREPEAVAG
jgi:hypothetical protein